MSNDVKEESVADLSNDETANGVSIHEQNLALKKELWAKGYYVNDVNRGGGIEYLIVSVAPPLEGLPIDHNAN
jgi:hypothetical protein